MNQNSAITQSVLDQAYDMACQADEYAMMAHNEAANVHATNLWDKYREIQAAMFWQQHEIRMTNRA